MASVDKVAVLFDNDLNRTYGGKIDFTDRETIMPIVEYVRGLPDVEGKP